jgi:hypothetical protein
MAGQSYRMRMYKRRLWQQRGQIALTGIAIWLGIVAIILVILEVTS